MSHRILVVDDEAHILQVLSLKLRNAGYEVITAVDGEEALEYATRQIPDVVITDFQMPYMTGLELCRAMAGEQATAAIPVLMLTARGHALDVEDLALPNLREVLSKPFSPRAVVEKIQGILGDVQASGTSDGPSSFLGQQPTANSPHQASQPSSLNKPHASARSEAA